MIYARFVHLHEGIYVLTTDIPDQCLEELRRLHESHPEIVSGSGGIVRGLALHFPYSTSLFTGPDASLLSVREILASTDPNILEYGDSISGVSDLASDYDYGTSTNYSCLDDFTNATKLVGGDGLFEDHNDAVALMASLTGSILEILIEIYASSGEGRITSPFMLIDITKTTNTTTQPSTL
jgi:hypothetical protein